METKERRKNRNRVEKMLNGKQLRKAEGGNSQAIQWLGLSIFISVALGSISGWELKSHKFKVWQKLKKKESRWSWGWRRSLNWSKKNWVSSSHTTQHPEGWKMLSLTADRKVPIKARNCPRALEYSVMFKEMFYIASLTGERTVCNTEGCEGFIKGL